MQVREIDARQLACLYLCSDVISEMRESLADVARREIGCRKRILRECDGHADRAMARVVT
ncbi:MAG TPA: hypothetical protein VLM85_33995 [Polyangiaceae bacterium]|nr:hypothetical protein [Polyangiaceae bacterium]